jgi:LuxR family quorum sensing-dependent transcriptional regulator
MYQEEPMTVLKFEPGRQPAFADLQTGLIGYADRVAELRSPDSVLEGLHAVTTRHLPLAVLGAARFPLKSGDWTSIQLGKLAFLHKSVPEGWWEEYDAVARGKFRPMLFLAATSMAMHTWTEARRMFQPIGVDNWTYDLALKHGMRDGLTCPVGGRWVVAFWSRKELSNIVTRPMRIMIGAAASFAALRLEELAVPDPSSIGPHIRLTPRELAVLRLVSTGAQFRDVAEALGLGEETVRSHLKKAQSKLGARSRTQAVAEALRQHLIP